MMENDIKYIEMAIAMAQNARENGDHPFGAVLVDNDGKVVEQAMNSVVTQKDCTGHAELNLIRDASRKYSEEFLSRCTVYASTEPCPMCAGALYWGNIRRIVYGMSMERLDEIMGNHPEVPRFYLSCRIVLANGSHPIEVIGPVHEEKATKVHEGFWDKPANLTA
jgi:tRNA(Arg) A34 adenosine deaminase TadA